MVPTGVALDKRFEMIAVFRYGPWLRRLEIKEALPIMRLPKPVVTSIAATHNITEIEKQLLEFRLVKYPEVGVPAIYEFTGEV